MRSRSLSSAIALVAMLGLGVACSSSDDVSSASSATGTTAQAITHGGAGGVGGAFSCSATPQTVSNPPPGSATGTPQGAVMHHVKVHTIYWLPTGAHFDGSAGGGGDSTFEYTLNDFFYDVGSTTLFSMASQYTDSTGQGPQSVSLVGQYVDTRAYPTRNGSTAGTSSNPLYNTDWTPLINDALAANPTWTTTSDDIYFIFTAAGIQACQQTNQQYCTFKATSVIQQLGGWHATVSSNGSSSTIFAYVGDVTTLGTPVFSPTPNDLAADPVVDVASHELFEAMTDPNLGQSWVSTASTGCEIGDNCNGVYGNAINVDGSTIHGTNGRSYRVQQEWSQTLGACTFGSSPPGAPGCTVTNATTCAAQYVPPANGVPGHYQEAETVVPSCPGGAVPSILEMSTDGGTTFKQEPLYNGNLSYAGGTPGDFQVGTQDQTNDVLAGPSIGTWVKVKSCNVNGAGTACDNPTFVQISACCTPQTTCEPGNCGSVPDGCGGHITCPSACPSGETCKNGWCQAPPTCTSPKMCCIQAGCLWRNNGCECI